MPTQTINDRFYVTTRLSGKLSLTNEGFLLCEEVNLAKTGSMIYGPEEVGVPAGPRGFVEVDTDPEDLFDPKTLASANGKPVLNEHPDDKDKGVDPENWRELTGGTLLSPRRKGDYLVGDLLIADASLIEAVLGLDRGQFMEFLSQGEEGRRELSSLIEDRQGRSSKREVSLGYDADYEDLGIGHGRKINILVNHIALVTEGRCGPTCKIQDNKPKGARKMANRRIMDRLRKAFNGNDKKGFDEAMGEVEPMIDEDPMGAASSEHHVHVHLPAGPTPGAENLEKARAAEANKVVSGDDAPAKGKYTDEELDNRFKTIGDSLEEIKGMIGGKKKEDPVDPAPNAAEGDEGEVTEDADGYLTPKTGDGEKYKTGDKEIEGDLEEEAPVGTGDKARKSRDSSYLADTFADVQAGVEILTPGMRTPTYDRKFNPRITYDNVCRMRKRSLKLALQDSATKSLVTQARGGREFDGALVDRMTCSSARMLFDAAVGMKKASNNSGYTRPVFTDAARPAIDNNAPKGPTSIAEMNAKNKKFYGGQ